MGMFTCGILIICPSILLKKTVKKYLNILNFQIACVRHYTIWDKNGKKELSYISISGIFV